MKNFLLICDSGALCGACLSPDAASHRAQWRKRWSGVPDDAAPCPHGKTASLTISAQPRKAVKAKPEVVELRVLMPCDKRTTEGKCTACKTCSGKPACRQVAEWRDCPEGKWEAEITQPTPP